MTAEPYEYDPEAFEDRREDDLDDRGREFAPALDAYSEWEKERIREATDSLGRGRGAA